ncbi:hypothetical protein [uncultured Kriegella sp.]|uniref:hypothetical protein n=1 Tax=uncultured Kriegella sp. TaxID=1798910 RepID=UPI0030DCC582|tara:strand:- start:95907 stop:96149 length:243 start_codon:yes stop_codon:yes gene_type:complete
MDLQTRKLTFVQEFLRIQNEEIISALEKILKKRKSKLYEQNLKPMSMEQFNSDIDKSLEDSTNDRIISAKDLKEEIKKWN